MQRLPLLDMHVRLDFAPGQLLAALKAGIGLQQALRAALQALRHVLPVVIIGDALALHVVAPAAAQLAILLEVHVPA